MAVVTLPFCDSFDHYDVESLKWTAGNANSNIDLNGLKSRTGIGCLLFAGGAFGPQLEIPQLARVVAGTAFFPSGISAVPKSNIMWFWDTNNGVQQVRVCGLPNMAVAIFTQNDPFPTLLGQSAAGVLDPNSYNYVEVDATISHAATVIVRVNNVVVLTLSGVNTQGPGSNPYVDLWQLMGGFGLESRHDDVYLINPGVTAVGSAFLGPVKVYAAVPFDNGAVGWTPLANTNWQEVSEIPPDGDTSYNFSGNIGDVDQYLYNATGVPPNSQVFFVQHTLDMKVDSGARTVASDAAGNVSPGFALTSGYVMYKTPYPTNPATGLPWNPNTDFPAAFGPKVTA